MKILQLFLLLLLLSNCNTKSSYQEICDCVSQYELSMSINESSAIIEELIAMGVVLDLNNIKTHDLIYKKMSERGDGLCPVDSRKLWDLITKIESNN